MKELLKYSLCFYVIELTRTSYCPADILPSPRWHVVKLLTICHIYFSADKTRKPTVSYEDVK